MKIFSLRLVFSSIIIFFVNCIFPAKNCECENLTNKSAFNTGIYPNLFLEIINKSEDSTTIKIEKAFNQLFYGDDVSERLYYPVADDMAYIEDVLHDDVRSEGMSYGMMISVQLDKKEEFDRLWKWAKTYMQHETEARKYYFAWQCRTNGEIIDSNSASDGEEWFVMALFFASARWGDGEGIFNYSAEAQKILDAMLNKVEFSDDRTVITNMFNKKEKQIVFVPAGEADDFTDPSYHLPHFYELWARWADKNNNFWYDAALTSREFFKKTTHPVTGLSPDYANFDGSPTDPFGGGKNHFQYDAWRVAMNIGVDYLWFQKDEWQVTQSNRLLNFFLKQGIGNYGNLFTLQGENFNMDHSTGLVAMNAVACLASDIKERKLFLEELWNVAIPNGDYRYYDGMLYMLGMLQLSGNFRIYHFDNTLEQE